MNWSSLTEFLLMGGYATYVWSSFFLFFSALAIELWNLRKEERELLHILMLSRNVSRPSIQHDHLRPEEVDS